MSKSLQFYRHSVRGDLFDYYPAILKEYKYGWRIEYYVRHPIHKTMEQKQVKVQSYVSRLGKREAKLYVREIVMKLNIKLAGGWSPFLQGTHEGSRMYEKLSDKYLNEKEKEMRPDTMRSYRSYINELLRFTDENFPTITTPSFNRNIAVRFMDKIIAKQASNTHYNNELKMMKAFFSWCLEKCYTTENPFDKIKTRKNLIFVFCTIFCHFSLSLHFGNQGNKG